VNGYTVLEARQGQEAVTLAGRHEEAIHLLVTDVVMPGMNVKEMVQRVKGLFPRLRVLYVSGYTANVIVHHGHLDPGVHFLHKPFTADMMVHKVREILDHQGISRRKET
jgi:YesN/AraC family two-component response regulator